MMVPSLFGWTAKSWPISNRTRKDVHPKYCLSGILFIEMLFIEMLFI